MPYVSLIDALSLNFIVREQLHKNHRKEARVQGPGILRRRGQAGVRAHPRRPRRRRLKVGEWSSTAVNGASACARVRVRSKDPTASSTS